MITRTFGFSKTLRAALGGACALGLVSFAGAAMADPAVSMAPPVAGASAPSSADPDSVFLWNEVPRDQKVPLTRAVFDQNGYQLYDTVGETIRVPFENENLYVMKFAVSPDGTTYFVNAGDTPVLYLPRHASLENTESGAQWYPFSDDFHPAHPVFLGVAPSWGAFVHMGWYPGMVAVGGYWSSSPFGSGNFVASIGLSFVIGGHHYDGWEPYHAYYIAHPEPFHHDHPVFVGHVFHGGDRDYIARHPGGDRGYGGGHGYGGDRGHDGGGHVFRGGGHVDHGGHDHDR